MWPTRNSCFYSFNSFNQFCSPRAKTDFGGAHRVLHEHRDGHRADAAGVWRDPAGNRLYRSEIHVAHQAPAVLGRRIINSVDSYVHYDSARLDHVRFDEPRHAKGRDEDVRAKAMRSDIARSRMAEG